MLKIVHIPHPVLTSPVKTVTQIDNKIIKLIKEMEETLKVQKDPEGVGLAAPQVGENLAIFIIRPNPDSIIKAFINPKIIQTQNNTEGNKKHGTKQKNTLEGCLSIPRIWSPVKRPERVLLEYQTVTGEIKQEWFMGFEAVIIQHEADHLQGILFTQRALEQNLSLFEEKHGELKEIEI